MIVIDTFRPFSLRAHVGGHRFMIVMNTIL